MEIDYDRVLQEKISQLRLIADWAAIIRLDRVRDLCRQAISEVEEERERIDLNRRRDE